MAAWEDEKLYVLDDIHGLEERVQRLERLWGRLLITGTIAAFLGSAAAQFAIAWLVGR